jgi:Ca2+/Na+ antiporter
MNLVVTVITILSIVYIIIFSILVVRTAKKEMESAMGIDKEPDDPKIILYYKDKK